MTAAKPWSGEQWNAAKAKLKRSDMPQIILTMDVLWAYLERTHGMVGIVMAEEIAAELGLRSHGGEGA